MTARDFTPTDEQVRGIASQWFNAPWEGATEHERASLAAAARELTALPAFQSIIAAAKAEAWDEGAAATAEHRSDFRAPGEWTDYSERTGIRRWIATPEPTNPYRDDEATA